VEVQRRDNGEIILQCPYPAGDLARSTAHILIERAAQYPDQTLIAEKDGDDWRHLTYSQAVAGCKNVAQWLLDHDANVDRPLAILSGSSINHFLMAWGAIFARVPYVPVSMSYSTVKGAFSKLNAVLQTVNPSFIFAEDLMERLPALESISFDSKSATIISSDHPDGVESIDWQEVISTRSKEHVEQSIENIDHDTITRYMFTSGSTGMPKGVIHTHGMNCHMLASRVSKRNAGSATNLTPRVLDWMPWSHVGAGVMRIANVINAGGSIFLDDGKPIPSEFHKTVENIRSVKPTSFGGAPLGWSMLVDVLESDEEFANGFYENIQTMQSGSAAMPISLADRIQALNVKYTGYRFPLGTSLLSTEVQCGLSRYWVCERSDVVGLPTPGVTVKLVPFGDKYELRVLSKGNTSGYLNDPVKTLESFDEEGFFKMGDAVRFSDETDPKEGLCFAGRVAEEFKLITGTWVSAGTLRAEVVASASPYVRDVVVCGLNQEFLALLVWPNQSNCGELAGSMQMNDICQSSAVIAAITGGFSKHNKQNPGSSKRIRRFLLLPDPPEQGAHEITDKGYVNQGAVQANRIKQVDQLFAEEIQGSVIDLN
jgi:feruloyl-CoA synthase